MPNAPFTLFSYTVRSDDGAAPNPFGGMCTLAICKPGIRRAAQVGDWIAGLGSVNAPSGDLSQRLVYAMRVDEILTLGEYDRQAMRRWPHRVPNLECMSLQARLGDCIYDFSQGGPQQRHGVHSPPDATRDLSGINALVSRDFYYFGSRAIELPAKFLRLRHPTEGFKSNINHDIAADFVLWIRSLKYGHGQLGWPDHIPDFNRIDGHPGCAPPLHRRKSGC
jgi:hypothetical protein